MPLPSHFRNSEITLSTCSCVRDSYKSWEYRKSNSQSTWAEETFDSSLSSWLVPPRKGLRALTVSFILRSLNRWAHRQREYLFVPRKGLYVNGKAISRVDKSGAWSSSFCGRVAKSVQEWTLRTLRCSRRWRKVPACLSLSLCALERE